MILDRDSHRILELLRTTPWPLTITAIAAMIGVSAPTASRRIARLEHEGFIIRPHGPRRGVTVSKIVNAAERCAPGSARRWGA